MQCASLPMMLFLLFIMKNAIIKKKKKKISLVVICDLVPMFSKTETDTLRSPPFKNWGRGFLSFPALFLNRSVCV